MPVATEGDESREREYRWRLEWGPILAIAAAFLLGSVIQVAGLAAFSPTPYLVGSILQAIVAWAVLFWIVVYMLVELQLWRKTRSPGHELQFAGSLLVVMAPVILWIPFLIGGWQGMFSFSPARIVAALLFMVSLFAGIGIALVGHYHPRLRASTVDIYRNVVVREGERIAELTDGYSTRVYTLRYSPIPEGEARSLADLWAWALRRAGLLLDHRFDDRGITVYPITDTGVGTFRLWTTFVHLYWLWRRPERLTWIRIAWDGAVLVHISPYDYARIRQPVAHHLLCAGVADAVVTSLLAFRPGQVEASAAPLLRHPADQWVRPVALPRASHRWAAHAAMVAALLLVTAGLASAVLAGLASTGRQGFAITGVTYPANPAPGQPVDVYMTLAGGDDFFTSISSFYAISIAYFNESRAWWSDVRRIDVTTYGVRIGAFADGTEVMFTLTAQVLGFGGPSSETTVTSGPYAVRVGQVHVGGASGLAIRDVQIGRTPSGNLTFSVDINSTAAIDLAQVYAGPYGPEPNNLTRSGNRWIAEVPYPPEPVQGVYIVVARDVTWNTATTGLLPLEATP